MQPMPGELSSIEHRKVQVHQHRASTSMAYARHGPLLLQKTRFSHTHRLLSKFLIVRKLPNSTSNAVIKELGLIFMEFRKPFILRSDNISTLDNKIG